MRNLGKILLEFEMIDFDKNIERERYDTRASLQLDLLDNQISLGSESIPSYLRPPYLLYERLISENISKCYSCLEIGAGIGTHSKALLDTGAHVVISDISQISLDVVREKFTEKYENFVTKVADMESLPFPDSHFDAILCAGSLSYGDPLKVNSEIRRVLRNGGLLIFVDSLGHNPIYRLNRWFHFLRNNRTKSTLQRIPTITRIEQLTLGFSSVAISYFGGFIYLSPIIKRLFGAEAAVIFLNRLDFFLRIKKSAFKFVLLCRNFSKSDVKI